VIRLNAKIASAALLLTAATPHAALAEQSDRIPAPLYEGLTSDADTRAPVALVADMVRFDNATQILTAEGNVEVYQGARTLTARRIEYNAATGRIMATGDVTLRTPEGVTLIADMADLDDRLRDALIASARMQLPGDARFAAARLQRIEGRYNVLDRAVFSPCQVCAADPTPLWRIRARRIVHDEVEKVVHYEDATFDILGMPVVWLPYFRHADPGVERASGLLFPEYLQSSGFGQAVKLPMHWVIDEKSDLTVTPFITTARGVIMEGEYRRTFESGAMTLAGSVTYSDYAGDNRLRGHIDSAGIWSLGEVAGLPGWKAGFDLQLASDDGYLQRYDFSQADRLTSEIFLRQSDRNGFFEVSTVRFQSFRSDEPFGEIPFAAPSFEGRRRVGDGLLGGVLSADAAGYGLVRSDGQDTAHLGLGMDWQRSWTLPFGVLIGAVAEAQADAWRISDASGTGGDDGVARLHPQAGLEARLPLARRDTDGALADALGGGVTHVIEPIVQAVVAPYHSAASGAPNEDSLLTEFDETDLFSLRRHSGWDGVEEGPRINLGVRYAMIGDDGADFSATVGRVFRAKSIDSYGAGAGLNGRESDFVGAWSLALPDVGRLTHRMRVSDALEITRNEVYGQVDWEAASVLGSYIYLAPDEITLTERHEVAAEAQYRITSNWTVGAELRRDLDQQSWVRTGGLVRYSNECVDLEVYGGRRYTGTADAPASTYMGLRVRLWALGDGDGARAPATGACKPQS
jgi:LPS-assembly protein